MVVPDSGLMGRFTQKGFQDRKRGSHGSMSSKGKGKVEVGDDQHDASTRSILIRNLPLSTTAEKIETVIAQFAENSTVVLEKRGDFQEATVHFSHPDVARKAVQFSSSWIIRHLKSKASHVPVLVCLGASEAAIGGADVGLCTSSSSGSDGGSRDSSRGPPLSRSTPMNRSRSPTPAPQDQGEVEDEKMISGGGDPSFRAFFSPSSLLSLQVSPEVPSMPAPREVVGPQWPCQRCTVSNPGNNRRCYQCGATPSPESSGRAGMHQESSGSCFGSIRSEVRNEGRRPKGPGHDDPMEKQEGSGRAGIEGILEAWMELQRLRAVQEGPGFAPREGLAPNLTKVLGATIFVADEYISKVQRCCRMCQTQLDKVGFSGKAAATLAAGLESVVRLSTGEVEVVVHLLRHRLEATPRKRMEELLDHLKLLRMGQPPAGQGPKVPAATPRALKGMASKLKDQSAGWPISGNRADSKIKSLGDMWGIVFGLKLAPGRQEVLQDPVSTLQSYMNQASCCVNLELEQRRLLPQFCEALGSFLRLELARYRYHEKVVEEIEKKRPDIRALSHGDDSEGDDGASPPPPAGPQGGGPDATVPVHDVSDPSSGPDVILEAEEVLVCGGRQDESVVVVEEACSFRPNTRPYQGPEVITLSGSDRFSVWRRTCSEFSDDD